MDLNAMLRLVFLEKNDITVGVLMGLLLLVVILLLIRSVMQEKSVAVSSGGLGAIDAKLLDKAIVGAVKKAMGDKSTLSLATGASASDGEVSVDAVELKKTLSEREAKISALMSDLEAVKNQMEAKPAAAGLGGEVSEDSSGLQSKIKELQTKLAEYEIIEDDIADLSLFKEENKKLKAEVEKLRATMETAQAQVQAVQTAVTAATKNTDSVQLAQVAVVEAAAAVVEAAPVPARKPPERFKLDTSDEVMGEFAEALSGKKSRLEPALESSLISGTGAPVADPRAALDALFEEPKNVVDALSSPVAEEPGDLFGELDTEKMLAEVALLKEASADSESGSVLDEKLDTERLMAEMGMANELEPVAPSTAAATLAPLPEAVSVASAPAVDPSDVPVDDLLAEFKDTEYQSGKKGS